MDRRRSDPGTAERLAGRPQVVRVKGVCRASLGRMAAYCIEVEADLPYFWRCPRSYRCGHYLRPAELQFADGTIISTRNRHPYLPSFRPPPCHERRESSPVADVEVATLQAEIAGASYALAHGPTDRMAVGRVPRCPKAPARGIGV